jgi:secretion/DNA translocation related CpaE-like protein
MPTTTQPAVPVRRPLAISTDPDLLDDLSRLAAAGGVDLEVAADPVQARLGYGPAPLVLVGLDAAEACRRARLPRRGGVVLVGRADDPEPPWSAAEAIGAAHVAILPSAEPWLVDRFAELSRHAPDRTGRLIAVIGGRGGAGASVLAAGLATTAVRTGLRTLLVDGDPLGGGMDLVLGWEGVKGMRWPGLRDAQGRVQPPALVDALPRQGDLVLLSWDRGEVITVPPEAMEATVDAGRQGRDLVVVDLPRRLDDAAVIALQAADRALLVVPAELRATAAAARVAVAVRPHCPVLSVVVRGPTPGKLTAKDVAASLKLPLAGSLRPEPRLAAALERGDSPGQLRRGSLATLCRRIVGDVMGPAGRAAA